MRIKAYTDECWRVRQYIRVWVCTGARKNGLIKEITNLFEDREGLREGKKLFNLFQDDGWIGEWVRV